MTKNTDLRSKGLKGNVINVLSALQAACELLRASGVCHISVATVTGIDLADYNHQGRKRMNREQYTNYVENEKETHKNQSTLNESILVLNRKITALNKETSTVTTWMAGVVHSHFNKTAHH